MTIKDILSKIPGANKLRIIYCGDNVYNLQWQGLAGGGISFRRGRDVDAILEIMTNFKNNTNKEAIYIEES